MEEGGVRAQALGQPTTPAPQGDHWSVCRSAPLPDVIQYLLELSGEVHIPQHLGLSWAAPSSLVPLVFPGFELDAGASFIRHPLAHTPVCTCCSLRPLKKLFPNRSHLAGIPVFLTAPPPGSLPDPPHWGQHSSMMRRQFLFSWPFPLTKLSVSQRGGGGGS